MAVSTATHDVPTKASKPMPVYAARPEGDGPHPALVVIMEVFGVNEHMKEVTRRHAEAGYVAVCPDLYYRQEPSMASYADMPAAQALRATLHDDTIIEDLEAVVAFLKQDAGVKPDKLGIVGYCFGGRLTYLAAARMDAFAASSIYYGGGLVDAEVNERVPANPITLAPQVACPVQGVWGGQDSFIPLEHVERLEAELKKAGVETEFKIYPDAGHGFCCTDRDGYHPEAAADAWKRTFAFFGRHLKN